MSISIGHIFRSRIPKCMSHPAFCEMLYFSSFEVPRTGGSPEACRALFSQPNGGGGASAWPIDRGCSPAAEACGEGAAAGITGSRGHMIEPRCPDWRSLAK